MNLSFSIILIKQFAMTDPITDILNYIRNAQAVQKAEVVLPFSKLKFEVASLLAREGFIQEVKKILTGEYQYEVRLDIGTHNLIIDVSETCMMAQILAEDFKESIAECNVEVRRVNE